MVDYPSVFLGFLVGIPSGVVAHLIGSWFWARLYRENGPIPTGNNTVSGTTVIGNVNIQHADQVTVQSNVASAAQQFQGGPPPI